MDNKTNKIETNIDNIEQKQNGIKPSRLMGWISFVIAELLVILGSVIIILGIVLDSTSVAYEPSTLGALLTFQGAVLGIVFGAVATKNFRR